MRLATGRFPRERKLLICHERVIRSEQLQEQLRGHAQRGAFICARGGACRAEEYALSTAGAMPRQEAESAASVHTTATAPSSTRAALPGGGL